MNFRQTKLLRDRFGTPVPQLWDPTNEKWVPITEENMGGEEYVLPIASKAALGGIKPDGVTIIVDPISGEASSAFSQEDLNTAIEPKADKTYVDEQLDLITEPSSSTQTLPTGTSAIISPIISEVDLEIKGRTLASAGNADLVDGGKYVISDPSYTVKEPSGTTRKGVSKFQFSDTPKTVPAATFKDKVKGSLVENPHKAFFFLGTSVVKSQSGFVDEVSQSLYDGAASDDGNSGSISFNSAGNRVQLMFAFNLVAHIEKSIGTIDSANKVQWIIDNVEKIDAKFYGYGEGSTGADITFGIWSFTAGSWESNIGHGMVSTTVGLPISRTDLANVVGTDGFVKFNAYSGKSDGVVAAKVAVAYIKVDVTLKSGLTFPTKPGIVKLSTFEGKVSGSTVENPHKATFNLSLTTLGTPTSINAEDTNTDYGFIKALDFSTGALLTFESGMIAQKLFTFDVIADFERNIGKIPGATLAEKVTWAKANLTNIIANFYGTGRGPSGYSVTLGYWRPGLSSFSQNIVYTSSSDMTKNAVPIPASEIDANGKVYLIAHAPASDGTTFSRVNTNFVSLEFEVKASAAFTDPLVPLYKVTDTEYSKILAEWDATKVATMYPKLNTPLQHLSNPFVRAVGEGLTTELTTSDIVLGQFGTSQDRLYKDGGTWKVDKFVDTDSSTPKLLDTPATIDVSDKVSGDVWLKGNTQLEIGSTVKVTPLGVELTYSNSIRSSLDETVLETRELKRQLTEVLERLSALENV
ncbi:hypothetical protein D1B33_07420 [Lysinibacillus yapensis]|uniref:Uncharacterized protein n=1 Tax=Ureibacillus yapensis TaxID=2304605 RepID=A0A396SBJ3_9BACL|nr:hypothetical protein [Lysinibacillus yapensis]RHW38694.1 hypothetical protein D1B33_07420 [Lysinibacillus yapensis]